jgi:hypothetical protein
MDKLIPFIKEAFRNVCVLYLFGVVGILAIYTVYCCYFAPISGVPGPLEASLSRSWLIRHTRKGDMHRQVIGLHERYGTLVRVAPNEISVTDPEAIKKIYGMSNTPSCESSYSL